MASPPSRLLIRETGVCVRACVHLHRRACVRCMSVHMCRTHTEPWDPTSRKSPHLLWLMQMERSLRSAL